MKPVRGNRRGDKLAAVSQPLRQVRIRRMPADLETPLTAYWKLAHDARHSFLLESVTGGEQVARYSMIGANPKSLLTARRLSGEIGDEPFQGDPLAALRDALPRIDAGQSDGLPRFLGGAVGMIGYDYVRTIEDLTNAPPDDLDLPDIAMMICENAVVFDHARAEMILIALAEPGNESQADEWLISAENRLRGPLPPLPITAPESSEPTSKLTTDQYCAMARRIKEYIEAGDCIQVVVSQRFSQTVGVPPVTLYRALRSLNPSPFMFLMRFGEFDVVGASPELLTSLEGRTARVRPIAGTRPRGDSHSQDERLAQELLADEKERAEHIMLVDLGRNDLGRIATPGSVRVERLMEVEMYSHVMHIVSEVTAELREDLDGIDLIRATFPAGTLSGAQKVRAMQIIDELEPSRRGLYGGAVGTLSASGDINLAIAIRTILLKDGAAHVQAGAGIVYDSVPESEDAECRSKARAALAAIKKAQSGEGF